MIEVQKISAHAYRSRSRNYGRQRLRRLCHAGEAEGEHQDHAESGYNPTQGGFVVLVHIEPPLNMIFAVKGIQIK